MKPPEEERGEEDGGGGGEDGGDEDRVQDGDMQSFLSATVKQEESSLGGKEGGVERHEDDGGEEDGDQHQQLFRKDSLLLKEAAAFLDMLRGEEEKELHQRGGESARRHIIEEDREQTARTMQNYLRARAEHNRETTKRIHPPSSWTEDNPIQLLPPKELDTTDASLPARSGPKRFDPMGFEEGGGLRRPIFYRSPFLTCALCNSVTFVDAAALRSCIDLRGLVDDAHMPKETLPPCSGCGDTTALRVGAEDLLQFIAGSKREILERRRRELRAARVLQREYRAYLHISYAKAQYKRLLADHLLHYRCALVIQAIGRGRLGRRTREAEKSLKVLRGAHERLIQYAVHGYPGRKKLFWYKTQGEVNQLFLDYRELVQRTGYRPARLVVEQNIIDMALRVLERQAELASKIQARWRGLLVRKYIATYRLELMRVREHRVAMTFRLQRFYRGHRDRKQPVRKRLDLWKTSVLTEYRKSAKEKADGRRTGAQDELLRARYRHDRATEFTARSIGFVNPKLAGGQKMKAFHESPYGSDRVTQLMEAHVQGVRKAMNDEAGADAKRRERADYVFSRKQDDPTLSLYYEDERRERNRLIIEQLTTKVSRPCKKQLLKDLKSHNARARSTGQGYAYPEEVYQRDLSYLKECDDPSDVQNLINLAKASQTSSSSSSSKR